MIQKGCIYKYTFPDGKVYIGQTRRDPSIRDREHFMPSTGPLNSAFWAAYQEQGKPSLEILETHESDDKNALVKLLNERETYYINLYKSSNPNYGCNIKATGTVSTDEGLKLCQLCNRIFICNKQKIWPEYEEMKKKIGHEELMTEHEKELYTAYFVENNPWGGCKEGDFFYYEWLDFADLSLEDDIRTLTCEYVHENAEALLEKYVDEDTIYQLSMSGEFVEKFYSQADAATAVGAKTSANINNVVLGKQESAYGYKWVRAIDYRPSTQLSLFD
ncbi:MAG: GIY-YIG nuclease family protein [Paludibacteraceae bacterium]|nr:GIY-YIG nuclease family protein [Paludibacteraceae bacterium]